MPKGCSTVLRRRRISSVLVGCRIPPLWAVVGVVLIVVVAIVILSGSGFSVAGAGEPMLWSASTSGASRPAHFSAAAPAGCWRQRRGRPKPGMAADLEFGGGAGESEALADVGHIQRWRVGQGAPRSWAGHKQDVRSNGAAVSADCPPKGGGAAALLSRMALSVVGAPAPARSR